MHRRTEGSIAPHEGTVTRRKWLGSLLIGGALAAVGGAVAMVRTSSYEAPSSSVASLRVLAPWQFVVVRAVARRMVAADRDDGVLSPDDAAVAEFIDGYLVEMHPSLRRDFLRLLGYTEHLAPLASGHLRRFTELAPHDQDDVLGELESSHFDQLRAGFQALKSIIVMGYYRDPRTFAILGYGGPFVVQKAGLSP
jgi:hypothetical protein